MTAAGYPNAAGPFPCVGHQLDEFPPESLAAARMAVPGPIGTYEVAVEDQPYAAPDGEPLLARVYRPLGAPPGHLLVDVHGGAWTYFDRTADACIAQMHAFIARQLV